MSDVRVRLGDDSKWEVWLDDLWVIGVGKTRREALMQAKRHVAELAIEVDQELFEEMARPPAQE